MELFLGCAGHGHFDLIGPHRAALLRTTDTDNRLDRILHLSFFAETGSTTERGHHEKLHFTVCHRCGVARNRTLVGMRRMDRMYSCFPAVLGRSPLVHRPTGRPPTAKPRWNGHITTQHLRQAPTTESLSHPKTEPATGKFAGQLARLLRKTFFLCIFACMKP